MGHTFPADPGASHPHAYSTRSEWSGTVARLRDAGCVFAEDEAAELLRAADGRETGWLQAGLARRVRGEPLEQVVGEAVFAGLRLRVVPGVFVPRRRTELLARVAADAVAPGGRLVDLCCGVGAVAAAVLARRDDVEVVAADLDPVATGCARHNLAAAGARAAVVTGDLYAPLPPAWRGTVAVLAANAPYVPSTDLATMPREARDHEPRLALDGGPDGGEVQRRVLAGIHAWLRPGGTVAVETSRAGAPALAAAMTAAGLEAEIHLDDDVDGTVVAGRAARGPGRVGP
ncbi:putative protein N(5)-glutamine methyltransferase [Nocardioides zeae]|uniref:Methyltransferase small domain-containing protein n=1 Tax=Nocardioides imazamoxiresistens TaxID=3231893 RepID=A0ABU3PSR5_9ACTN|nr:putative protein N(5)-glutamine methyltransferase [Nocardioides zeae]MDT9592268.1 putative protein N(5)-glutamine methyltransferase [Nocardioides zeae]